MRLPKWLTVLAMLCTVSVALNARGGAQTPAPPKAAAIAAQETLSATPPMGWNSWDSFGTTVTEADIRSNALWMHEHLQPFGWQYITVDMEWYTANPTAEGNGANQRRSVDAFGRFIPDPVRFPSSANGAGFAPLAAYVHSLGLRFGIHILQGVPREAMAGNLPIEGTALHARDAGDPERHCAWNPDYVDARPNDAAQGYYNSIARLYAAWGVDLVKVDCVAAPLFKDGELAMLRKAFDVSGRALLLSTSPGEPPIEHAPDLQRSAQQWRISNDVWDIWHNDTAYPQGVRDQFARTAYWNRTRQPGHWPDADMLPLGSLRPAPGWGSPRSSRLSPDEQQTMLTLWSMFRSPLIMGGNLPETDAATLKLLTNAEVLAVDQHSSGNLPVLQRPDTAVWTAYAESGHDRYVAVFNLQDSERTFHFSLQDLGLERAAYQARDLWAGTDRGTVTSITVRLRPHASQLLRLR